MTDDTDETEHAIDTDLFPDPGGDTPVYVGFHWRGQELRTTVDTGFLAAADVPAEVVGALVSAQRRINHGGGRSNADLFAEWSGVDGDAEGLGDAREDPAVVTVRPYVLRNILRALEAATSDDDEYVPNVEDEVEKVRRVLDPVETDE